MQDQINLFIDDLSKDWDNKVIRRVNKILVNFKEFCDHYQLKIDQVDTKTIEVFLDHERTSIKSFLDFVKMEGRGL